jgi:hypothetical protein
LRPELTLSRFALLAYTGARLPSDGFSVVDPLVEVRPPCERVVEIAGYRHHGAKLRPSPLPGDKLEFVAEPDNVADPNAIAVKISGNTIGYVTDCRRPPSMRGFALDV